MKLQIEQDKYDELVDLGGGTQALLAELLDKYLENSPKLITDAKKALQENNAKQVDYCIHTLKGSTLCLGLQPLGKALVEVNVQTKLGDISGVDSVLAETDDFLSQIREYRKTLKTSD